MKKTSEENYAVVVKIVNLLADEKCTVQEGKSLLQWAEEEIANAPVVSPRN